MPKQAQQSDKWEYKVTQVKLMTPDGNFSGFYGNQREDNQEILGVTSEQYGILQNKTLMDSALEALEDKGLSEFEQRTLVTEGGKRFFAEFTFKNKQLATKVGDVFGYQLTLQNSFDRSLRAAWQLGFIRLTCLNGASSMTKEFNVTAKHSSNISGAFLADALDKAIANGAHALAVYDELARVNINDEQGGTILTYLERKGKVLSGTLREDILTLWLNPQRKEDRARNLYNLYNAITEHMTHKVAKERFEYANKVSALALSALVGAARNPKRLVEMVTPLPTEIQATITQP